MNTYLVPTTAAYCYEPYDHIYLVYGDLRRISGVVNGDLGCRCCYCWQSLFWVIIYAIVYN